MCENISRFSLTVWFFIHTHMAVLQEFIASCFHGLRTKILTSIFVCLSETPTAICSLNMNESRSCASSHGITNHLAYFPELIRSENTVSKKTLFGGGQMYFTRPIKRRRRCQT